MDLYLACPQRSPIACPPSMSSPLKWTLIPPPVLVTPTSLPKTDPPTHPLALCGGPYCAPFLQTAGGPTAGCRSWPPAGPPSPPSAQSVLWVPLVAPSSSPGRGGTVPRRSWGWGTAQSCCSALGKLGDSVRFASMLLGPTSRGAWSCMRLWVSTGLGGGGKGGWGDSLSWLLPAGMHGGKPRQSRWCSAGVRIRGEWCGGQWGHGGCSGGMREGKGIIVVLMRLLGVHGRIRGDSGVCVAVMGHRLVPRWLPIAQRCGNGRGWNIAAAAQPLAQCPLPPPCTGR